MYNINTENTKILLKLLTNTTITNNLSLLFLAILAQTITLQQQLCSDILHVQSPFSFLYDLNNILNIN